VQHGGGQREPDRQGYQVSDRSMLLVIALTSADIPAPAP
jgi:hypothetical protein